jgi:putative flavoprotein involved in K+ transport
MPIVGRIVFHRLLTISTPIGKKVRPKMISSGEPLIRVKPKDLEAAGVERVPRVTGVHDGSPQLEDGRTVEVANVVWCTGFHPGFSWIDLPVLGPQEPLHKRGVVASEPGLYFIGLKFLYAVSSEQIQGVGRDADYIAKKIAAGRKVRLADRSVSHPSEERDVMATPQERPEAAASRVRCGRW